MKKSKFYQLDSLSIGNKTIIPIACLKVITIKNIFINIDFEVSAFKIIENKKVYFKNIKLNQQDFEYVENNFSNF